MRWSAMPSSARDELSRIHRDIREYEEFRVDKQFFINARRVLSILARNLDKDYAEVSDTRVVREINNIVGR